MAGGNEAQRSDRFDLPKNRAFTFITKLKIRNILAIPCGHCAAFPPAMFWGLRHDGLSLNSEIIRKKF
ncbi:MAG: hypothetical protein LBC02_13475 [Planctomycetaceae bacterium]|nr:hypothetical protein [Planctomycetaceae bacterium]